MAESPPPSASPAESLAPAKFHTALNVSDLARSVSFYRLLFGREPARQLPDYAKFELSDPPLVLSLIPGHPPAGGQLNHLGLRMADSTALAGIQRRLEEAGIPTQREEGVECCHSKQTKFWVRDPDRVCWEIYIFHQDAEDHDLHAPFTDEPEPGGGETAAPRITWQHRIGEPAPERIPHAEHSVHEILFEGTANLAPEKARLAALFAEAFRVLRPGGEVRVHGLTGDAPLAGPLPPLPGPASAVEAVPPHAEVVRALLQAGFVQVCLEKLSATAHFTVEGIALRELLVSGRKPGHRPKTPARAAIYLGPLAQVTDDFGNSFRRGESVALNIHDWQALSHSPAAAAFLLL